jgi:hypothetical protein
MIFWPLKTVDVPIGDIASIRLAVATANAGDGASCSKAYPEILLKSGRRIAMAAFTEAASKRAVAAMSAFLEPKPATPS